MIKNMIQISTIAIFLGISMTSFASSNSCELPPDIDEDKTYTASFEGYYKNKGFPIKILDVDGCWVKTFRPDGDHVWFPINKLIYITSKAKD